MTKKEKLTFLEKLTGIKNLSKSDETKEEKEVNASVKDNEINNKSEEKSFINKDYIENQENFTISLHNKNKLPEKKITQINMDKETEKLEQKDEEEGQLTIDVYQTASEIVIKSPVAGVRKEDLDVNITNDMVTIKGRRENDDSVVREDYFFQELYWGPFSRSVILPSEIDTKKSKAILRDGILTIKLPKIDKEITKKLSIELG